MSASGHRGLPHTADIRIEAWAPTREECLAEAVAGLVESFADLPATGPAGREWLVALDEAGEREEDTDTLVRVLDEVIYVLETEEAVPARVETRYEDGAPRLRFHLVPLEAVELTGAVPKAVTLHELRFGPAEDGWSCTVTVDV